MKPNDKAIEAARAAILKAMAERNCIIAGVFDETNYDEFEASEAAEHAKVALDAAYAAQFQSEDYAGLVESLRQDISDPNGKLMSDWDSWRKYIASGGDSSWPRDRFEGHLDAIAEIHHSAADAIEALLAEREAWKGRQEATAALLKQVYTERDALLAHLAPVDDDILREISAMHFARIDGHSDNWDRYVDEAKDYIDAIRPHIEAAERERCAKIAEARLRTVIDLPDGYINGWEQCQRSIAAAIRRGK